MNTGLIRVPRMWRSPRQTMRRPGAISSRAPGSITTCVPAGNNRSSAMVYLPRGKMMESPTLWSFVIRNRVFK